MSDIEKEMAENFYGFGSWTSPYWFIGPEQGQGKSEDDDLGPRLRAWESLGKPELADLKEFHDKISQGMWTKEGTPLQKTWRKLMLVLFSSRPALFDTENLREYQRTKLGRARGEIGETCLIELSGLPANSSKTVRDRKSFLDRRISRIVRALETSTPKLIIMYGKGQKEHFAKIVKPLPEIDNAAVVGKTVVLFTKHTNARKLTDEHWRNLGKSLSEVMGNA
jgi:hypothetical protein